MSFINSVPAAGKRTSSSESGIVLLPLKLNVTTKTDNFRSAPKTRSNSSAPSSDLPEAMPRTRKFRPRASAVDSFGSPGSSVDDDEDVGSTDVEDDEEDRRR